MSETIQIRGIVKKIERLAEETNEEMELRLYNKHRGSENHNYYNGLLLDEYYDEFTYIHDDLYKVVIKSKTDELESFTETTEMPDGTIEFFTQFYNGGTYLQEMLESKYLKSQNPEAPHINKDSSFGGFM